MQYRKPVTMLAAAALATTTAILGSSSLWAHPHEGVVEPHAHAPAAEPTETAKPAGCCPTGSRFGPQVTEKRPAFLGVAVAESPAPETGLDQPRRTPVLTVTSVHPGSPAEQAGLLTGDTLIRIDDQQLLHPMQLVRLIQNRDAGSQAKLHILRDGESLTLDASFIERPAELAAANPAARQQAFPQFRLEPGQGQPGQPMPQEFEQMFEDMQQRMQQLREEMQQGRLDGLGGERFKDFGFDFDLAPGLQIPGNFQSNITINDGIHTLNITTGPDGRHLKATDAQGNILFDGPIDTDEQLDQVPADIREKIPTSKPQPRPKKFEPKAA
jgi:hypothetical protein